MIIGCLLASMAPNLCRDLEGANTFSLGSWDLNRDLLTCSPLFLSLSSAYQLVSISTEIFLVFPSRCPTPHFSLLCLSELWQQKNPTKLNPSPSRESNSIPHPLCPPLCPKSAPASNWTWNIPLFSKKQTSWIFISVSKLSLHSTTVLRIRETMENLGKAGDWCHLFSCAFMKEVPWRCSAISPLFGKWHLAVENKDKLSVNFN